MTCLRVVVIHEIPSMDRAYKMALNVMSSLTYLLRSTSLKSEVSNRGQKPYIHVNDSDKVGSNFERYDGTRRCALLCNGHIYSAFAAHTCIPKLFWVSHHLKYCTNTYPSQPMNPVIVAEFISW